MEGLKCTFKWQEKVYSYMARQKCTYKLQHKSVRLYGKTKLYV